MARRRLAIATILFTVFLPLPARADTIRITGGSIIVEKVDDNKLVITDVHGTQGFGAQLRVGLNSGPWIWFPADPGTAVDLRITFDATEGFGRLELRGQSFDVGGLNPNAIGFNPLGGPVILPPLSAHASLSAPFALGPSFLTLDDHPFDGERFPLLGRGTATIEMTLDPEVHAWGFAGLRYDFEPLAPTPEPATVLLLGGGMLALTIRRLGARRPKTD